VKERQIIPFVDWAEKSVVLDDGKPIVFQPHQRKILSHAFSLGPDGKLPYSTVIYSCVKKSGKTTIAAIVTLWIAFELEPRSELILAANDYDQAAGRVYKEAKKIVERSAVLKSRAPSITTTQITLADGTVIKAIPTDATGEAGANQSLSAFDELWGYTSERSRRLYEELTPVPTRRNSIRFISTYAGYTSESTLLEDLYHQVFDDHDHLKPGVEMPIPGLPCYAIGNMFVYWDHHPRMPWQTVEYYRGQRQELRPTAYLRLHENRWVSSESGLFDMALWDACVDRTHRPPLPNKQIKLFVGVDASVKKDRSAVVSVYMDDSRLKLGPKRFWQPTPEAPMDLEETMEAYLLELKEGYSLAAVRYDPYQFHRSATTLKKLGLPMEEFPQSLPNLTEMGQNLFDLVKFGNIVLYACSDMRKEATAAIASDSGRGMRIVKEKSSHKIDQIISLAMACHGVTHQKELVTPRIAFVSQDMGPKDFVEPPPCKPGEVLIPIFEGGDKPVAYEKITRRQRRGIYLPGIR